MGVQDLVRLVLPKDDHFFDFLEEQAKLAHEAAKALHLFESPGNVQEIKERIHAIEKRGDKQMHELEEALAKTFVTPLDREDLHKMSAMLDDILDRTYACASAFDMFCIDAPSDAAVSFFGILERASAVLAETVPCLRKRDYDSIREAVRKLKGIEKEGDEVYRTTMRKLFGDATVEARALIREKEIIEILENAVDGCEDAAEYMANLAVKHG